MLPEEYDEIEAEMNRIKILLDFHIQNKQRIALSESEFIKYVDAALDQLNELKKILSDKDFKG